jgi:hypothetical protein
VGAVAGFGGLGPEGGVGKGIRRVSRHSSVTHSRPAGIGCCHLLFDNPPCPPLFPLLPPWPLLPALLQRR